MNIIDRGLLKLHWSSFGIIMLFFIAIALNFLLPVIFSYIMEYPSERVQTADQYVTSIIVIVIIGACLILFLCGLGKKYNINGRYIYIGSKVRLLQTLDVRFPEGSTAEIIGLPNENSQQNYIISMHESMLFINPTAREKRDSMFYIFIKEPSDKLEVIS